MRIKKLELCGFKSFKDRTVIHFDAGITGIVGPNGCGKSNIVDALVWAMGEQSAKHLRGSAMQDLIFGGAEGYAPSGMAEVSLTLENDGGAFPTKYMSYSEIMVTRKLHRSGESEYLINKETARLKDVHEIFMDTGAGSKGFSIIAQGTIGKIIVAKPTERRTLIEEAAGITKFKVRKRESERKLDATDQNLLRLNDIIIELKRQIDHLERQAKKAERYRSIKEKAEDLDLWISSVKYFDLKEVADNAQSLFDELKMSDDSRLQTLQDLAIRYEEKRQEVEALGLSLQAAQEEQTQKQSLVQDKRMELQNLRFEVEQARRKEEMTGSLLQEMQARKSLLEEDCMGLEDKLSSLREASENLRLESEAQNEVYIEQTQSIHDKEEELTTSRRQLVATQQAKSSLEGSLQAYLSQQDSLRQQTVDALAALEDVQAKVREFERNANRVRAEFEGIKQMSLLAVQDVENLSQNKDILFERVKEKRTEVETFKDEFNAVTSRLYGLETLHANFEGFQDGVKSVMMWKRQRQEVHADGSVSVSAEMRPISDVVSIPEEFELAMEAALGTRLQMLLSENGEESLQAVDYLKEHKGGRSSFFNVEHVGNAYNENIPVGDNVVLLQSVVSSPEKYQKSVNHLIGNVAVVDSIRSALQLRAEYKNWTFVTREGDTLTADGVLTGGTAESAGSGILQRGREIKDLLQQKEEWSGKLALASVSLKKMESQLDNLEEELEKALRTQAEQEIRAAELRKDTERVENELRNAKQAVDKQVQEKAKLDAKENELSAKVNEIQTKLEDMLISKDGLEHKSLSLESELQSLRLGIDDLQKRATNAKVAAAEKRQEAEGVERQLQMLTASLTEVSTKLVQMNDESANTKTQLSETQVILEQEKIFLEKVEEEVKMGQELVANQKEIYEGSHDEVRSIEEELNRLRLEYTQKQTAMNEAQLRLEQSRMKEGYLVEQIRERYMAELAVVAENYRMRDGDQHAAEAELQDLKDKLNKMGEVNLSSISEFDETVKRYEFLSKQQEDLLNAKKELQKVIDRINRICSRRFKETFEAVNERFKKAFPVLFGGGEASLTLIEDEEKGEMGIDIMARPPGKKLQTVNLLSGGEKALTAVALIFSIFLVKPSPYCLLDEVDAPLDDANVMRFNELVKEMAKRSQIIVVTHNKHTMEINNKLYGVTMQERGVSKMVSVNLQDAAKIVS